MKLLTSDSFEKARTMDVTTPASVPPPIDILHFHVTGLPMER